MNDKNVCHSEYLTPFNCQMQEFFRHGNLIFLWSRICYLQPKIHCKHSTLHQNNSKYSENLGLLNSTNGKLKALRITPLFYWRCKHESIPMNNIEFFCRDDKMSKKRKQHKLYISLVWNFSMSRAISISYFSSALLI